MEFSREQLDMIALTIRNLNFKLPDKFRIMMRFAEELELYLDKDAFRRFHDIALEKEVIKNGPTVDSDGGGNAGETEQDSAPWD